VLGLQIIPTDKRHPLKLSSKGMGELLVQINQSVSNEEIYVNKVTVGIGGTGTNDLGLGLSSIFGLQLIDINERKLEVIPENYFKTNKILWSKPNIQFKIESIVDVNNPLLGKLGATQQFAKQKGATKAEIRLLEMGFNKIINILNNKELEVFIKSLSGAGGGLAAGLSLFFEADCISSFENIRTNKRLSKMMEQVDLVITGEGVFDKTSLLGKGASAIIKLSEELNKKVFLCCGKIDKNLIKNFDSVVPIEMNKLTKGNEYKKYFEKEVKAACNKILAEISE